MGAWRAHLAYARYLFRHKWFVFVAGRELRVPVFRALVHDWSKFLPDEWVSYVHAFYRNDGSPNYDERRLAVAWNAHQKRNPHHWQYWILTWERCEQGDRELLEMPEVVVREMVADWLGAGRAQGKPDLVRWWAEHRTRIRLHGRTRDLVDTLVREVVGEQG